MPGTDSVQLSYCYCMSYKQNVVTKVAYFLKIDYVTVLLSRVRMPLMMLLLVPPQKFAFLCCGIIDGRELCGRGKVIMSQHFSVLYEYAINDASVSFTSEFCIPLLWYDW